MARSHFKCLPLLFPKNHREVDDSKRHWGPLPGRVKKEHKAEFENGDSDARTLGVLGYMALE